MTIALHISRFITLFLSLLDHVELFNVIFNFLRPSTFFYFIILLSWCTYFSYSFLPLHSSTTILPSLFLFIPSTSFSHFSPSLRSSTFISLFLPFYFFQHCQSSNFLILFGFLFYNYHCYAEFSNSSSISKRLFWVHLSHLYISLMTLFYFLLCTAFNFVSASSPTFFLDFFFSFSTTMKYLPYNPILLIKRLGVTTKLLTFTKESNKQIYIFTFLNE